MKFWIPATLALFLLAGCQEWLNSLPPCDGPTVSDIAVTYAPRRITFDYDSPCCTPPAEAYALKDGKLYQEAIGPCGSFCEGLVVFDGFWFPMGAVEFWVVDRDGNESNHLIQTF